MRNILVVGSNKDDVLILVGLVSKHMEERVKDMREEFAGMGVEEEQYEYKITTAIGLIEANDKIILNGCKIIVSTIGNPEDFPGTPFCSHSDTDCFGDFDFICDSILPVS